MNSFARKSLATLALAALAACSGTNGAHVVPSTTSPGIRTRSATPVLARIVGVGDSLSAGYQAGGMLGETGVPNAHDPGHAIPPTQEQGWWPDLDEQASGLPLSQAIAREYDPATSPLPLIKGPGLNNQIVPASSFPFFAEEKSGNTCAADGGFNAAGYLLNGLSRVRMNPRSAALRDLAVPGITLHEANTLFEPQTDTCEPLPGTAGLISEIIGGESSTFWPVLGNFAGMGTSLTMVNAAASLHPTLATVWLGANDVLKYMGTGGLFVGGDNSAAQAQSDLRQTILTLQYAGAKTVVANLPNVLETPYFQRVSVPPDTHACLVSTYVVCLFEALLFQTPASARKLVAQIAASYHLATPAGCTPTSLARPCGYLTLQGTLAIVQYFATHLGKLPDLDCKGPDFTPPCIPGSSLGPYYITPALAAKIQALNNAINQGINEAAISTNSALVDVTRFFDGVASGNPANPYFRQAGDINPGVCCTLTYGGGLVSFDGLHPSNTGYALLAYYFIKAINAKYRTKIPEIDVTAAYDGTRCSDRRYCFPDPYAPPYNKLPRPALRQ
jgi:lysophospholipase L1-like esterase